MHLDADDLIKGAKSIKKLRLKNEGKATEKTRHKKPRLFDYINKETMIALFDNAMDLREVDNNVKADRIVEIMGPEFQELGTGTNRIAMMKDKIVFKIALDRRGMIDNLAEYKRSAEVPEYLAKCYETNRVVAISEYVNVLSREEYENNRDKLKIVLSNLTSQYVIKDLGLTPKNYCNWGYRDDGSIVALDYAYMYPLKGNPNALRCSCGGTIELDSTFTTYTCNNKNCMLKYSAMEILNKMNLDSERIDDEAVFNEAGVDLEEAEIKFGDEFVNYIKIKKPEDEIESSDDKIVKVSSEPINSSPLAEALEKYQDLLASNMLDDDDSFIDMPDDEDDEIYKEDFEEALYALDRKRVEQHSDKN